MTTYINDRAGNSAEASAVTVPSNRNFRDSWTLEGNVISEDLTVAKQIFKDKIVFATFVSSLEDIGRPASVERFIQKTSS